MVATKNPTTVGIYCRVSTGKQRDQRTIESQLLDLRDLAERRGYQVFDEYTDDGISGADDLEARSAFQRLLNDCTKKKVERILCVEINRLLRSENDAEEGMILQILKESSVVVETPGQELDLNDPMLRLLFKIQAWGASEERKEIMRKTQRGQRRKREQGYWMGPAPFGYEFDKETRTWSFNREEKELYLWMIDKFLIDGWSMSKICRYLDQQGIVGKHGRPWAHSTLSGIFRSTRYYGELYANRHKFKGKNRVGERPRNEWIKFEVPPMIEKERWLLIQDRLRELNVSPGRPSGSARYLLKGLLVCGLCGARMYQKRAARPQDLYYVCHNRSSAAFKRSTKDKSRCDLPYVPTSKLDEAILHFVVRMLSDQVFVLEELIGPGPENKALVTETQKERDGTVQSVKRLERKESRLLDLYAADADFSMEMVLKKILEVRQRKDSEQSKIDRLEAQLKTLEGQKTHHKAIRKQILHLNNTLGEVVSARIDKSDFADKRQLLKLFFETLGERIKVYGLDPRREPLVSWKSMMDFRAMEEAAPRIGIGETFADAFQLEGIVKTEGSSRPSRPPYKNSPQTESAAISPSRVNRR